MEQIEGSTRGTPQGMRFTIAQAAEACGVSRDTIKRRRAAGAFPNAEQDGGAWLIPLADLLAAGLRPGRPSPPEAEEAAPTGSGPRQEDVIDLREQVADLRGRLAERDRAEARAAELVEQLQAALRGQVLAIEAGRADAEGRIAALEQARAGALAAMQEVSRTADEALQQARADAAAAAEQAQALQRALAEQADARRRTQSAAWIVGVALALLAAAVAVLYVR
jgi:hypothetical protein